MLTLKDFKTSINLIGTGQNIADTVGCYGIQSAAEGVQLDEVQIIPGLNVVCGGVQPAVVHPLIHDDKWPL